MRLLNTSTIQLHEFFGSKIPFYAILSHRWEESEISFKDVTKSRNLDAPGWAKVRASCALAKSRGKRWIWIDTCCIDRRSSAELSEAINSMFAWYKNSIECYAYLVDVLAEAGSEAFKKAFRSSEWFIRGWTLQELIAPRDVIFFNQAWTMIGTKYSLGQEISSITGIEADTWDPWKGSISSLSIARRMSWASRRVCTREEDMAYCLLGIFDINMPLLYGEGGSRAFRRLQLEILKTSDDESIFAWYSVRPLSSDERSIFIRYQYHGDPSVEDEPELSDIIHREKLRPTAYELLAPSPAYFFKSHSINYSKYAQRLPYTVTNKGLQFSADKRLLAGSVYKRSSGGGFDVTCYEVPLNCYDSKTSCYFCLHIYMYGFGKDGFESLSSRFYRLHPAILKNPPADVIFNRSSAMEQGLAKSKFAGMSDMQTIYLNL